MKKILTITVLALALCLIGAFAFADVYSGKYDTIGSFETFVDNLNTLGSSIELASSDTYYPLKGSVKTEPTIAELKKLENTNKHAEYNPVKVEFYDELQAKTIMITCTVRVSAHDYSVFVKVDKDAECGVKGTATWKCSKCDSTITKDVSSLTHQYKKVSTTATCTAAGKATEQCTNCGKTRLVDEGALDHNYIKDDKTPNFSVTAPSCSYNDETVKNGTVKIKCTRCNTYKATWATTDETAFTTAFGAAPTVTDGAAPITVAQYAKYSKNANFDGHHYDLNKPARVDVATCDHAAQKVYRCTWCGHDAAIVDKDSKPLTAKWAFNPKAVCGDLVSDYNTKNADGVDAYWYCTNCNSKVHAKVYVTNAEISINADNSITVAKEGYPTVTLTHIPKVSSTKYSVPSEGEEETSIAALSDASKAKWCTEGVTKTTYKCSVCGQSYTDTATNTAAKPGHVWEKEYKLVDDGLVKKWVRNCTLCNAIDTRALFPGDPTCEHDYKADAGQTLVCGANANIWQTCSKCGAQKVDTFTRKDNWKTVSVLKAATCTEKGSELQLCTYENCANTQVIETEALGHDPVATVAVPATCKEAGKTAGKICSRCGEILEGCEPTAIDETAHVFEEEVVVAATCKVKGVILKTCKVCGKTVKEEVATLKHEYDEGVVTTEPTTEKAGVKTFTCKKCGDTYTEEIAKLDKEAKYEVEDLKYTNPVATGTVKLEEGKALKNAYARVTFFLGNGDCMIQIVEVAEDGTFKAGAIGNFVHISVVIVDVDDAYGADEAIEHAHGNAGIKL